MSVTVEYTEGPPRKYTVNGDTVPSVTQILGVLDKPALVWWGMTTGVEGVCKLANLLGDELDFTDPAGVVSLLTANKMTVNHVRDQAGSRGTGVHDAAQSWATERKVLRPQQFPIEERGYVRGFTEFLLDHRPEFLETEVTVGSAEHSFAGRFDTLARLDERLVLLDYKTSKRIYPEQFLQLSGYELARLEMGAEASDGQMVLRLAPDGSYELAESYATGDMFLGVKAAYDALQQLKRAKKKVAA